MVSGSGQKGQGLSRPGPLLNCGSELVLTGSKTEKFIVPRALLVSGEPEKGRRVVTHGKPSQWGAFWGAGVSGCLFGIGPDPTAPETPRASSGPDHEGGYDPESELLGVVA